MQNEVVEIEVVENEEPELDSVDDVSYTAATSCTEPFNVKMEAEALHVNATADVQIEEVVDFSQENVTELIVPASNSELAVKGSPIESTVLTENNIFEMSSQSTEKSIIKDEEFQAEVPGQDTIVQLRYLS